MAAKDVKFGADARERMLRGIDILADAVQVTLAAIAKARQWMDELLDGTGLAQIAKQEGKGERQIRSLMPLAFVSPKKLNAIVDQRQSCTPTGLAKAVPMLWAD